MLGVGFCVIRAGFRVVFVKIPAFTIEIPTGEIQAIFAGILLADPHYSHSALRVKFDWRRSESEITYTPHLSIALLL